jgi:hypothetical protein
MPAGRSIGQPFADCPVGRPGYTFDVIHAKLRVAFHTAIELCQISMQVLAARMFVGSNKAALEDAEVTFWPKWCAYAALPPLSRNSRRDQYYRSVSYAAINIS